MAPETDTTIVRQPGNKFLGGKGRLCITATFNNTLITVTDDSGNVVCWGSTGSAGFKGSRKSTPFAATTAIDKVLKQAKALGLQRARVYIKGPGPGRDAVLRVLRTSGVKINLIADVTPMAHNGCRPKKQRRV
jgi:small subunit ribosomal protein S11